MKKTEINELVKNRLFYGLLNSIITLIVIYIGTIGILLVLGVIGVVINWFITGQINIQGHNGLAITSEVGYTCYLGDSNCYEPINSNMFWIVFEPIFTRIAFSVATIFFILSLTGLKMELKE